jgi:phosphonate transport system substrate-binding protein
MRVRRLWLAFVLGSAVLLALLTWLFGPRQDDVAVPVDDELVQARSTKDDIVFAVSPVLSPEETFDAYRVIAGWLARELDQPVRLVQRRTYDQVNQLLAEGTAHFAIVCTGAYLQAIEEGVELEPILIPIHPQGPVYYSLIVVNAELGRPQLSDLMSARWAFADPLSLTGHFYPLSLAIEHGVPPSTMLENVTYTYSHHDSLHALIDGIADVAAVDSHVFDYEVRNKPEMATRLRIIHRSPPLGIQPVVAGPSVDPEMIERFRQALVSVGSADEGRQLLAALGLGGFTAPPPDLYDDAAAIYRRVYDHVEEGE